MKALLLGVAMTVIATGANAAVLFDFSTATGNLGNTHVYNSGALSITASGFSSSGGGATALFGKANGGDENGVGLADDPSLENEITGTNFIQLDVSHATASTYSFIMGSTTGAEGWDVFGSNVAGVLGGSLLTGSDELTSHNLAGGFKYYDFQAVGDGANVLLSSFTANVPEPATWIMMILGFGGVGFMMRRARQQPALA